MARPNKHGLDYFPFDVDFFTDFKVRKLMRSQSGKAVAVYACLLCNIYKNGYYVRWDNELPFYISEQTGFEEVYIQEVIKNCTVIDLFSKEMFEKYNILTSKGIQKRYLEICRQLRRSCGIGEFSLVIAEETPVIAEETPVIAAIMQQSKVNKIQIKKESKKKENPDAAHAATPSKLEKREKEFYSTLVPFVGKYPKEMIRAFYDYWREKNKSGARMRFELEKTWEISLRLSTWANRDKNFNKSKSTDYDAKETEIIG